MHSKKVIATQLLNLVADRRIRAFAIGVIVLVLLAVLQVNNLQSNTPMCELLAKSNLGNADLQRMQIALSQSGLREYQLKDNSLLVPSAQHSIYLQAVVEKNAIPEEFRQSDEQSRPSINPFLSRPQQLAIERTEKKHQVREMVLRLPFVEQVWFEMDKSDSHSAFEKAEQSAVVSIRTPPNTSLTDQHVDTVKRMIGGAVAGLGRNNIVVIDLSAGFAHPDQLDPPTTQQVRFQRVAIEQQHFYENQIREILKNYPGIKVTVHVEVKPTSQANHVASIPNLVPITRQPMADSPLPAAGANSFASIENFPEPALLPIPAATIAPVSHTENITAPEQIEKQISVTIDVPQKLVYELFGSPPRSSSFALSPADLQARMANDTNVKFEQLRSEIIQKIRPVLPCSNIQNAATPIIVSMIRDPLPEPAPWFAPVTGFASQNWPSAAVLVIGLMLLSIVTRKPDSFKPTANSSEVDDHDDLLSISSNSVGESGLTEKPEIRLSKLIEQDPDAAARVIETWIRDAA